MKMYEIKETLDSLQAISYALFRTWADYPEHGVVLETVKDLHQHLSETSSVVYHLDLVHEDPQENLVNQGLRLEISLVNTTIVMPLPLLLSPKFQ